MSQWTHISGIVRFDSMNLTAYPVSKNQEELVENERLLVERTFSAHIPAGSEGPLEVVVKTMERGATVFITGDLRDFGEEDLSKVVDWVNDCLEYIDNNQIGGYPFTIRDIFINCNVENNENRYIIEKADWVNLKEYRGV